LANSPSKSEEPTEAVSTLSSNFCKRKFLSLG
jgi:hypothetical protein